MFPQKFLQRLNSWNPWRLRAAIREHRSQKADDRCIEDDDRLYAVLADGVPCDRRVGDKFAMLHNCARFIDNRCTGGGWLSYAELEQQIESLRNSIAYRNQFIQQVCKLTAGLVRELLCTERWAMLGYELRRDATPVPSDHCCVCLNAVINGGVWLADNGGLDFCSSECCLLYLQTQAFA